MKWRRLNQIYARLNGYFWLPCSSCGKMFGGHEWGNIAGHLSTVPDAEYPYIGHGICRECTVAGVGDRAHAALGRENTDA